MIISGYRAEWRSDCAKPYLGEAFTHDIPEPFDSVKVHDHRIGDMLHVTIFVKGHGLGHMHRWIATYDVEDICNAGLVVTGRPEAPEWAPEPWENPVLP